MSEKNEEEIWKDIPSKPGYQASNFGRIRSLDRWIEYTKKNVPGRIFKVFKKGKVLTPVEDNGYIKTTIGWSHRFICEAFHGPAPEGCTDVNHIDENKKNNRPENLEWMSHSDNVSYGMGYINRIKNQLKTRQMKKLKELGIAWPKCIEIMELFY